MNEDTRWTAVESRDASQRGRFVYAVQSTGIFCRAGCPSRTPRRDRVTSSTERPRRGRPGSGPAAAAGRRR